MFPSTLWNTPPEFIVATTNYPTCRGTIFNPLVPLKCKVTTWDSPSTNVDVPVNGGVFCKEMVLSGMDSSSSLLNFFHALTKAGNLTTNLSAIPHRAPGGSFHAWPGCPSELSVYNAPHAVVLLSLMKPGNHTLCSFIPLSSLISAAIPRQVFYTRAINSGSQ